MSSKLSHSERGKLGAEKSKATIKKLFEERIKKYYENPKLCGRCGKTIEYNKKNNDFCNHSCAASFCNNGKRRHGDIPTNKNCLECESPLSTGNKFCRRLCQQIYTRKKKVLNNTISSKSAKVFLIQTQGNKCSKCGWCEINKTSRKVPIELNHIDGNSENNAISNLELLCPNCHSLTSTYKALNKGKGRAYRKERYRQGKSF